MERVDSVVDECDIGDTQQGQRPPIGHPVAFRAGQ
jgi:hypothetical protein